MPDWNFASPHCLPAHDGLLEEFRPRNSFPAGRPAKRCYSLGEQSSSPIPTKNPIQGEPHRGTAPESFTRKTANREKATLTKQDGRKIREPKIPHGNVLEPFVEARLIFPPPSLSRKQLDALDIELEGCQSSFTSFQWKHTQPATCTSAVLSLATAVNLLITVNIHCQPAGTTSTTGGGFNHLSGCLLYLGCYQPSISTIHPSPLGQYDFLAEHHSDPAHWSVEIRWGEVRRHILHRVVCSQVVNKSHRGGGRVSWPRGQLDPPFPPISSVETEHPKRRLFLTRCSRAPDGGRGLPSHDPPRRWRVTGHNKQAIHQYTAGQWHLV